MAVQSRTNPCLQNQLQNLAVVQHRNPQMILGEDLSRPIQIHYYDFNHTIFP